MANKKISELTSRTPALSDLILVGDPSSGYSYKCTVTALATIIETDIADGFVTIGTTQTISGAKTFSNNLTLTSVANATTTQTKFLTLNASNVVNYRTGAEVLADIGGASSSSVSGTTNYVAKFTSSSAIGNSTIQDNGSLVTIGSNTTINTNAPELTLNQGTSSVSIINFKENNSSVNRITSSGAALYFTTNNSATTSLILSSAGTAVFGTIPNATIDTDKFLVSDSGVLKYRTGAEVLSDIGGQGTITLAAIGSTPNANGATLSSNTLTLQPASASFGGVLTTGFQEIAGWKRFTGNPIQFDNHLEIKNLNSWGVSWGYTSFASKDTPVFGFLRGHSSTGSVTYNAWFTYGTTGDRNYTLPSSDGTLALTSQVPTVSGTTNYIPKFTSSSAIGNSAIYDNGGNIGVGLTDAQSPLEVQSNSGGTAIRIRGRAAANSGTLRFFTNDGVTQQAKFEASDNAIEIGGLTNVPLLFYTNNSERMRLDASGNLGLGTSSPYTASNYIFATTNGTNGSGYVTRVNGTNSMLVYSSASASTISEQRALPLVFETSGSERARIDASGNLGLGTSSPSSFSGYTTLSINNATNGAILNLLVNGTETGRFQAYANTLVLAAKGATSNMLFETNGSERMRLDASGNLGIGTSSPALKLVVSGPDDGTMQIRMQGTAAPTYYWEMGREAMSTGDFRINESNAGSVSNRFTIKPGGNVGIGTTSPTRLLHLDGGASTTYFQMTNTATGSTNADGFQVAQDGANVNLINRENGFLTLETNNTERMRITSGGDVLVATTTASFPGAGRGNITIGGSSSSILSFQTGGSNRGYLYHDGTGLYVNNFVNGSLSLMTNNTDRLWITSGGNVGIGTTSPTTYSLTGTHLDVAGGGSYAFYHATTTSVRAFFASRESQADARLFTNTNHPLAFGTNDTERMRITSGGNVGIGTSTPGSKLSVVGLPTSSAGLSAGDIWNDGGTLKIV